MCAQGFVLLILTIRIYDIFVNGIFDSNSKCVIAYAKICSD